MLDLPPLGNPARDKTMVLVTAKGPLEVSGYHKRKVGYRGDANAYTVSNSGKKTLVRMSWVQMTMLANFLMRNF